MILCESVSGRGVLGAAILDCNVNSVLLLRQLYVFCSTYCTALQKYLGNPSTVFIWHAAHTGDEGLQNFE